MGLEAVHGPATGFLEWSDEEWEKYHEAQDEDLQGAKLGGYGSIADTVETVRANLEDGNLGSRFPLFMRIARLEGGWYLEELPELLREILTVRDELAALPLERIILAKPDAQPRSPGAEDVEKLRTAFRAEFPDRQAANLADFNHYLLDTLQSLAESAVSRGKGIVLC
jgi:hypothetical protein